MLKFQILNQHGKSRTGILSTAHGEIQTPVFMPVGTAATVKAMTPELLKQIGAQIILANTYHLMIRPGEELIENSGGLHKFMNWNKPILTDSGGFQVMSLKQLRNIDDRGVEFRSHLDGKKYFLTPEYAVNIQHKLDSNITMVLDECTEFPENYMKDYPKIAFSMHRSMDWAKRSKQAFIQRPGYGIFGIIQGGIYRDLRRESIKRLVDIDFDGYAVGGVALSEGQNLIFDVIDFVEDLMPRNKPRYLMGVGKPKDIVGAVMRGIDMFDCVIPTRSARNGQAFTTQGNVNITKSCYIRDNRPLDSDCSCYCCTSFTRAYLNHLVRSREILGSILMTIHNLTYFQTLMARIRSCINNNQPIEYLLDNYESADDTML